jgi:hypothetical protein
MTSTRHRWGDKVRFEHKTEQQCARCEVVRVTRHEWERGREIFWTEFWRNLDRVDDASGKTPPCDGRLEIL